LDVPRANTLIVDDAQELGLAQMYQLRGRVGRRAERAYAYFFTPPEGQVRKETAERLEAITSLEEVGSGYSLACRDLEIRGGGDFLGHSQHGGASKHGFQFFYRLLEQEVARLKGTLRREISLSSELSGSIPTHYIPQERVRVAIYRRLLHENDLQCLIMLKNELQDRFGQLPADLQRLFDLTLIRNLGASCGLKEVNVGRKEIEMRGNPDSLDKLLGVARSWVIVDDRARGPGGEKGVALLASMIRDCLGRKGDESET
jgi:transcription-repair coupling factor (superfamily II helicase)